MMISSPDILPESKLRLAILYALRYQKFNQNNIPAVIDQLKQCDVPESEVSIFFRCHSITLDDVEIFADYVTYLVDGSYNAKLCRSRSATR